MTGSNCSKGTEGMEFLCLLYAAFAKVNAYAMVCVNVAFQWIYKIKLWLQEEHTKKREENI